MFCCCPIYLSGCNFWKYPGGGGRGWNAGAHSQYGRQLPGAVRRVRDHGQRQHSAGSSESDICQEIAFP
jgi:hypothetical protein